MFRIESITSDSISSDTRSKIYDFCRSAEKESRPESENMSVTGWESNRASLISLLEKNKRFANGNGALYLAHDDPANRIAALSGVNLAGLGGAPIAIGAVRSWTLESYRLNSIHGEFLVPKQVEWARSMGMEYFFITFNRRSYNLVKFFQRGIAGRTPGFGVKFSNVYKDMTLHPKMLRINYTPQYVFIKKLSENPKFALADIREFEIESV